MFFMLNTGIALILKMGMGQGMWLVVDAGLAIADVPLTAIKMKGFKAAFYFSKANVVVTNKYEVFEWIPCVGHFGEVPAIKTGIEQAGAIAAKPIQQLAFLCKNKGTLG